MCMCKHAWHVSTTHGPTRSGLEHVINENVEFLLCARFWVAAVSVCRHVWDVAHSTSHEPTRSGLAPTIIIIHVCFFWCVVLFATNTSSMCKLICELIIRP